jgi:DNA polymerase-1
VTPYKLVESDTQLARVVAQLMERPGDTLAVDTETTGLDPLAAGAGLLLVQIGDRAGNVWVIDARRCDVGLLRPALETDRLCVLHNAKFDYKWLLVHAGIDLPRMFCTMIAELMLIAGLYPVAGHRKKLVRLAAVANRYLGVEMEKGQQKSFAGHTGPFTAEQLQYAADDVPHLLAIQEQQAARLAEVGMVDIARVEFRVLPAVAAMELNGMGIDRVQYAGVIDGARAARAVILAEIHAFFTRAGCCLDLFGDLAFNIDAPAQLVQAFKSIGVTIASTEDETLKTIDHPLARLVERYREQNKRVTTYGDPILDKIHPVTGRIHAEYQQLGSDAGRFSCDSPNLQQIPATKEFRDCFIPGPGRRLIIGDYSQFEPRITAQLARCEALIETFRSGRDLYSETAARMYGMPYEEAGKGTQARQDAKIITLALAYGMGAPSLARDLGCLRAEAEEKMERYNAAYPGVAAYLKRVADEVVRRGETRTLMGRRRLMPSPGPRPGKGRPKAEWESWRIQVAAMERKAKNTPIQGSNADFMKVALRMLWEFYRESGIGFRLPNGCLVPAIVASIHDEILSEVEEERAEEAREYQEAAMLTAPADYLTDVPVKADAFVSDRWEK